MDLGAVLPPRQVMAARGLTYSGSGNTGIACSTYASYELEICMSSWVLTIDNGMSTTAFGCWRCRIVQIGLTFSYHCFGTLDRS